MADVRLTATNPEDSTVVPVACNAKGELKLEEIPDQSFDGNLDGDLTVSGSATFAGCVQCDIPDGSNDYCFNGLIRETNTRPVYTARHFSTDISTAPNFQGMDRVGTITSEIFADGSAAYAGRIRTVIPNVFSGPSDSTSEATCLSLAGAGSGVNSPTAELRIGRRAGGDTNAMTALKFYLRNRTEGPVDFPEICSFGSDGSATFAGNVYCRAAVSPGTDQNASEIGAYVRAQRTTASGGTASVFAGYQGTNATPTSIIKADGSVTFAGNKAGFTAEGYLWCTTERGDTVMLEATVGGAGMWKSYTPPRRRDEIKDAWSEKNVLRPKPEDSSQKDAWSEKNVLRPKPEDSPQDEPETKQ